MSEIYYRHSGRFSPFAILALLLGTAIPAAVAGAIYGAAVLWIPIIYVNFFLTFGLGFLAGWLAMQIGKAMQVRNIAVVTFGGLIAGLVALDAAWVGWIFALSEWETIVIASSSLLTIMPLIAEEGVWGLSANDPVRGLPLYGIWLIEAGMILGVATIVPFRGYQRLACCEPCRKWIADRVVVGPFAALETPTLVRSKLESGEFAVLGELTPAVENADTFTEIDLWRCSGCDHTHLMTVRLVTITYDKQGKVQRTDHDVVRHMIIDHESRELIAALGRERQMDIGMEATAAGAASEPSASTEV